MSGSGGSASKPILGEYFCDPRCSDAAGWGPDGKCAARGRVGLQEYKEYPVQTSLKPTWSQTRGNSHKSKLPYMWCKNVEMWKIVNDAYLVKWRGLAGRAGRPRVQLVRRSCGTVLPARIGKPEYDWRVVQVRGGPTGWWLVRARHDMDEQGQTSVNLLESKAGVNSRETHASIDDVKVTWNWRGIIDK